MRNQRGVALSVVVIVLFVLIGMVGLAVDVGRIAYTAAEAQAAADAGAIAGAWALLKGGSVSGDAGTVVSGNQVNGATATMAAGSPAVGTYSSGVFAPGGTPADAVRVTVTTLVDNIVMGILGDPQSTVAKPAVAAILNLGGGSPNLPLVIGACKFTTNPVVLARAPSTTDNSAWTSFFDANTNTNTVGQYLSQTLQGNRCENQTSVTPPELSVGGDPINVTNGVVTPPIRALECMYCAGIREFVVPVVPCSGFTGAQPVLGFATIRLDSFCYGPSNQQGCTDNVPCCGTPGCSFQHENSPKGINATVTPGEEPGPGGGGAFGTRTVRLAG